MKELHFLKVGRAALIGCALFLSGLLTAQESFVEYKGVVSDSRDGDPLVFASLTVTNSNISTVTNTEGEFVLKIPDAIKETKVNVSLLGYEPLTVDLAALDDSDRGIELTPKVTELNQINITGFTSAKALVKRVFKDKNNNHLNDQVIMTAFYRETIKRRSKNVSLTEAVVNLYKQPYSNNRRDIISLHKARKSTDYRRLDTVALKLQGGPFSVIYLDIMKYPEYIFTDTTLDLYDFSFAPPSAINDRPVLVVEFNQKKTVSGAGYQGKLYIDAETFALTSATYSLNIVNTREVSELFVRKKPRDINVYPTQAAYKVDYRERNGKWYFGYGSVQLSFKVNKRRKLFNSSYTLASEMAVTDWEPNESGQVTSVKDRLKPTVILADAVSGFSDPNFWGPLNVIEPEKSIESAIQKIRRKLTRKGS